VFGGYFLIDKGVVVENYSLEVDDEDFWGGADSCNFGYIYFFLTELACIIGDHLSETKAV
jgi:hypothetical protein